MTLRIERLTTAALLTLAACQLPTKLGELPTTEATTMDSGDVGEPTTMDPGDVDEPTTGGITSGVGETAPTTGEATGGVDGPETTTGGATDPGDGETASSGQAETGAIDCAALTESECGAQAGCAPAFGVALEFPGCPEGQVYLGCDAALPCDTVLTTVCRDGSDEAYKLPNSCVPPGFSACQNLLSVCGTPCVDLDQESCEATAVCRAIFGNPHVDDGEGGTCVDDEDSVYLACDLFTGACPPVVHTVCPMGQPNVHFDVPSGCFPPFFLSCPAQSDQPACP